MVQDVETTARGPDSQSKQNVLSTGLLWTSLWLLGWEQTEGGEEGEVKMGETREHCSNPGERWWAVEVERSGQIGGVLITFTEFIMARYLDTALHLVCELFQPYEVGNTTLLILTKNLNDILLNCHIYLYKKSSIKPV